MPVSFFNKTSSTNVWKSVTDVSAAGLKRGRGKGTGRAIVEDFNRGQEIGFGRRKLVLPGLNVPVTKSTIIEELGRNTDFETNITRVRNEMNVYRKFREPPLGKGWSGRKAHGRSAGQSNEHNETSFEGFNSTIIMSRPLLGMSGILGRTKRMHTLVVTGNGNRLAGFSTAIGNDDEAFARHARYRVAQTLVTVKPITNNPFTTHEMWYKHLDRLESDKSSEKTNLLPIPSPDDKKPKEDTKRSLSKKIIDEVKHYYHGFRLLFIDLRISSRYVRKLLNGEQLSRREHQQLVRSTSDLFRLVPFSVFIIVPFMEFLLPVFLKFFPSMLPSTFQTSKDKDAKIKTQLKVKLDMAKFLQQTLDEMAFQAKGESHSEEAKKFAKFFEEVRATGAGASNADILKYSKLFEDEITLDSMTRQQLVACCKLLELQPIGTNVFLRFQLRMRLKALKGDDEMIKKEGIKSLTVSELQAACRARGMRALGVPIERLQAQLSQWLELSLNEKIPPSLLLLSRALYVPENIPTAEQLKVTIQSLPELAGTEVRYNIGETEGKVDNKTKLEFLRQEEEEIQREELQESVESFKTNYDEELIDKAEEVIERAAKMNQATILKIIKQKSEKNDLTLEFLTSIEHELDKMLSDKEDISSNIELPDEEYDLRELKEEMEEYREEIGEKEAQRIRETKAARRLSKRVDKLIIKLDKLIDRI